jgi:hypothetical protein
MTPVSGLHFLRRARPGTAEVSLRHVSGWLIGGCRSSNLTVSNAALASASIEQHRCPLNPVSAMRAQGLIPDGCDRFSVRQGFCSFARRAGPLARTMSATSSPCKAVWRATCAAS